ncbi:uncharacterized protein [Miscanthus floridulus]|uniref:uncharacterized protein n=1 Tax=Miscanthus floridulus TaxID=154761 RepID=UPI0034586597
MADNQNGTEEDIPESKLELAGPVWGQLGEKAKNSIHPTNPIKCLEFCNELEKMRTWLESHVRFGVSRLGPGSSWGGRASAILAGCLCGRRLRWGWQSEGPGGRRRGAGRVASGAWPPEGRRASSGAGRRRAGRGVRGRPPGGSGRSSEGRSGGRSGAWPLRRPGGDVGGAGRGGVWGLAHRRGRPWPAGGQGCGDGRAGARAEGARAGGVLEAGAGAEAARAGG